MKKKTNQAPKLPDVELLPPAGWMQRSPEDAPMWQATVYKAAVLWAFFDYYRRFAEKLAEADRIPKTWLYRFAPAMADKAMEYVHGQIDQAMQDAVEMVMQEAINRLSTFMSELYGADESTWRQALPPRVNIEKKALDLLRRRHAAVPFRGKGPAGRWTRLSLTEAALDAMKQIDNVKNRTKWRVAATMFKETPTTNRQRNTLTSRLNQLLTEHGVDYAELERMDDRKRAK